MFPSVPPVNNSSFYLQGGVCFSLRNMDQVLDLHQDDFDVTVEPGVTRKTLNGFLRDTGLWFPVGQSVKCTTCCSSARPQWKNNQLM